MAEDLRLGANADSISSLAFHPTNPSLLLVGSWDRAVYLNNIATTPPTSTKLTVGDPVLALAWAEGESQAFVAGLANQVKLVEFDTNIITLVTTHNAPVKSLKYSSKLQCIISGSWDKTIRLTRVDSPSTSISIPLPDKIYDMDLSETKLVVAMGSRAIWIFDLKDLADALDSGKPGSEVAAWQKRESSLKFMTRAVRCMPNDQGYVTTSIEGRVAVEFYDPEQTTQAKKYAFKCHRQVIDDVDHVFPVSGLAFNAVQGTFATGGGDATVSVWDPFAKKRLRQFPKYPSPISVLEFNADGTKLAVGFSQDDEGGKILGATGGNGVYVRTCGDECKPKEK